MPLPVSRPVDPAASLARLLEQEQDRICRLWAKRVKAETYELDMSGRTLRAPLAHLLEELKRLLQQRGEEALHLWPEVVRSHGARRYDMRFDAEDLVREFKALEEVLLYVYARRTGGLEPQVAEFIVELVGEANASAQAAFSRVLRTEEVRFREAAVMESVLHHVDVGILLAEADGTISFASPPVSRLVGVPMRAVVGGRSQVPLSAILTQVQARHPNREPFRVQDMPFFRVLKEKGPVRGVMVVVQRPGGTEATLELNATPVWDEDGTLAGVIQTFTDRTEAADKTRALRSAHDELRRLHERLLQRTRTQALGQLAGGAAHALNNLLNVLRLRLTLLRREPKAEHLEALNRTVGQVGELVARLQEFTVERTEETLADVPMDTAVREALELVRAEMEQPANPVTVEFQSGNPSPVRVDPGFFREVLVSLLLTERERMARGGRLTLCTETSPEGMVVLRLRDDGPAYSPEEMAGLFDPMQRGAGAPQQVLQLAVSRHQVQRWGGDLCVENLSGGQGAAFVLRLPRARPEASAEAPRAVAPRRFQQTRRVLVVDDDVDNAQMLAEVLGEEGYEVQVAHSGEAALKLWDARRYDAALLDALMPDLSGWEVARQLRQRSPQALLAIVTGMDVRGQNRASLALVDAVFRKPIDVGALDEFLAQAEHPAAGSGTESPLEQEPGYTARS